METESGLKRGRAESLFPVVEGGCSPKARVEWRKEGVAQAAVQEDCSAERQAGVDHLIGECACRSHWASTHGGREQMVVERWRRVLDIPSSISEENP